MSIMPDVNRGFSAAKFVSGNGHSARRRGAVRPKAWSKFFARERPTMLTRTAFTFLA